jgi:FkbM family methyltransferase
VTRNENILATFSRFAIVRRLYAALRGAPILGPPLRRFVRKAIPPGTRVWVSIAGGLGKGLSVNLDTRFEMNYATGNYEPLIEHALSSHLQPGSVFYDVGAHIGVLSMIAARIVSPAGVVFAFEPDPGNVERIEEHARRNMLNHIKTVPFAAWSSGGRLRFERAPSESSRNQGALAMDPGANGVNIIEVDAISLDEFAHNHPPPSLIKLDVEGAEASVLRGSEMIFSSVKPALICEVHNEQAAQDVTRWLADREYTFEWLQDSSSFPRHLVARFHD